MLTFPFTAVWCFLLQNLILTWFIPILILRLLLLFRFIIWNFCWIAYFWIVFILIFLNIVIFFFVLLFLLIICIWLFLLLTQLVNKLLTIDLGVTKSRVHMNYYVFQVLLDELGWVDLLYWLLLNLTVLLLITFFVVFTIRRILCFLGMGTHFLMRI